MEHAAVAIAVVLMVWISYGIGFNDGLNRKSPRKPLRHLPNKPFALPRKDAAKFGG
jgi:hypothetical protein